MYGPWQDLLETGVLRLECRLPSGCYLWFVFIHLVHRIISYNLCCLFLLFDPILSTPHPISFLLSIYIRSVLFEVPFPLNSFYYSLTHNWFSHHLFLVRSESVVSRFPDFTLLHTSRTLHPSSIDPSIFFQSFPFYWPLLVPRFLPRPHLLFLFSSFWTTLLLTS